MSREPEIDQLFVRLCALVDATTDYCILASQDWQLVEGIEDQGRPRTQWAISDRNHVILPLGYTRRQVLASLTSMCSILAVLLGA